MTAQIAQAGAAEPGAAFESADIANSLADYITNTMQNLYHTLDDLGKTSNAADKAKIDLVKEELKKQLDAIEKEKKAGFFKKLFKALGFIGLIISAIVAFVFPSPVTIAMFAVTLVMLVEPMVSEALGKESIIQKGIGKLCELFTNLLGPIAGAIVGAIMIIVMVVAATAALAYALSAMAPMFANAARTALAAVPKLVTEIKDGIAGFLRGILPELTIKKIMYFCETCEALIGMAMGGVQIAGGINKYEMAKLLHECGIDQANINYLINVIEQTKVAQGSTADILSSMESAIPGLLGPRR